MNINKNALKVLIKQVMNETRNSPESDSEIADKELTWKKITDNLNDEGFRLVVLKSIANANKTDSEFMSDMFETLTKEEEIKYADKVKAAN